MVRLLSNIPIFRRLFTSFAIATAIPAIVIILLGNFYVASLTTRSLAVQKSFDAQSLASQEQTNLNTMNALLQTRFNQIFASLSGSVTDPSLVNAGGLVSADIAARQAEFDQSLDNYQTNFNLVTSPNMSSIRSILINDNPATGPGIITDQQDALQKVATNQMGLWDQYAAQQEQEVKLLDSLDPSVQGHPATFPPDILSTKYRQAYNILWHANFIFTNLHNDWQRVADDAVAMGKTVTSVGPSVTQPVVIATIIAVLLTSLIVLITGWLVNLTITFPLRRLAALTTRITQGDRNARAEIVGRDEINLVANSMNSMLDNIVRLYQEVQSQHEDLQAQAEKLVGEVSGVGEGDLRVQAEVSLGALGVLADSFNFMVEELSGLIVRVKRVAHEVENSTTITYGRMHQLVESADAQIKQIATATTEVEHMANASRQVAERAQILYGVAHQARRTAESGRNAVQQTVEGMGRIQTYVQNTSGKVHTLGEHSKLITNITEVITAIAYQTNRLALDASIQAAMAGDNGKGFAAVAADIRRLAERCKEEASSIGRVLHSVREEIGAVAVSVQDTERETSIGAKLAEEAGSSLASIFGVVERQAQEIESINQLADQQLQSSSAVVHNMRAVNASTEQSSTSTRQTARDMGRLARLAAELLASVDAFRVHEHLNNNAPRGTVTVTPEELYQKHLSGSGGLRHFPNKAQPAAIESSARLAPVGANGRAYPPSTPHQAGRQGNDNDNGWSPAPNQSWPQQQRSDASQSRPFPSPLRRPGNNQQARREDRQ